MLELQQITKVYRTGGQEVSALKDINLAFRASEFVSVLGQSGSGKTTLLNIIGGLDQYTAGDLLINGRSTKAFKDRDWDAYRNHTIGFVFQSYNLISHQTALSNVEMALTLSGVSKTERRRRAMEVLRHVGLAEQAHKRPNQMSGGQMQRVAIARALVNNPDILLADEPTGALDSETSVQIMELLKDIAKDRLVIMVTHNPDLAARYSTRIIKVLDGRIVDDSDPYSQQGASGQVAFKKTKMRFWTALALSFNNLLTKKGRTFLTAFAGSIGIIGIALILSLSNGVQDYIDQVQEDTLVAYPLSLKKDDSNSLTSLFSARMEALEGGNDHSQSGDVGVNAALENMLRSETADNDLETFKNYLEKHRKEFEALTKDIHYSYDLSPQIYAADTADGITAVNPSDLAEKLDTNNVMVKTMAANMDVWSEISSDKAMLSSQYQMVAGHLPNSADEVILMVDENNNVNDLVLYSLGLKDAEELNHLSKETADDEQTYAYDDLLGQSFKLVIQSDLFQKENGLWTDKSSDQAYMSDLINKGEDITIVGIVKPQEGTADNASVGGIGYTQALTKHISEAVKDSQIAKEQLADKGTNVFTGQAFSADVTAFSSQNLTDEQRMALAGMTAEELAAYVSQYNQNADATYEDNAKTIGIIDLEDPSSIHFYARSFEDKENLKDLIDDYNRQMKKAGKEAQVISYTDDIALVMSSVTTMINMITYVLVGFVAISLVVSSIMIAIITYISVLERTKEIGILRAMGASKKDVRRIFTAETAIEGAVSGVMGIVITLLLNLPINSIIEQITDAANISVLPVWAGAVLIAVSILLTVLAGVIPSRFAAKKDPVEALHTE
ncbi:ATP-binding cassette domain-containing protein [Streptococcus chenjunshii]|uniref:ATP-binding cassette domain-containing protein n=1 Tax=Streptococcus chenjunshii TaxID=2173853 RepID=A0A372KKH6_9STRE|nr:ABC transporter ATP-binding protein/permease [Streptococcus chenjunshii]AXQ78421.1 ATP-binding cassette domain-containing protein [Streptococcus chenjunshii]RFU50510.1 ATP-binding cassette domain-containing protein [Streptococcus chenjunshii]RFU52770.1 ATP-binding cassette domain-containing protein [Streptococcus chenjunshii]